MTLDQMEQKEGPCRDESIVDIEGENRKVRAVLYYTNIPICSKICESEDE